MGRFHVVDEDGDIIARYEFGITADGHAGQLSDLISEKTFLAIDTKDGSVYGAYRNGLEVKS